ncbi:MAG: hypothetical protein BJ554DRAFT_6993 [Olpidium bornovanus]|uniref:Methionyl/Leucyl tRNA synthetase domain-containing protein n=1 Tax=Olpidium bornovanus TaxID=278681 RepID=A0A8H7ZWZ2_9FUNG|nr:MAG: hypothetical protein BJ554DRAFT_6993 [Olpidium bornovanus]
MPNQVTTVLDPSTGKKCTVRTGRLAGTSFSGSAYRAVRTKMAIGSGHLVEWASEVTYKFRLSKFTDDLRRWLSDTPEDALASYLTVSGYPDFGSEAGLSPTSPWPADVHIVGKDILRFHAIYWPAFLLAAALPLPRRIVAHAHWMMDHHKMSKSRGNVVDPFAELELYGAETVRLYLMRFGPMANDCSRWYLARFLRALMRIVFYLFPFLDYDRAELAVRYKKDLQAQVGNLLQRTTSVAVNPNQVYPAKPSQICHEDDILFREKTAPWDLAKRRDQDPSTGLRLRQVLYHALEVLRVSGTFLQAVLPCKAETLLDRLGVPRDRRGAADATLDSLADDGERDLGDRGAVLFPPIK